ncbi:MULTISPECIES: DUF2180 family protein [Streptomyces]|uniref:DUF2180 family protein n=1 Tax=Streptomyces TaxID=1883 RepID=UPI001D1536FF|nr:MULTISPECIES: DUF2180 family protein [Streptomyces]MCC3652855.1 DUF2180 family protein [Streptomyces sp. S07_1.15]WSQ72494.1 DUF2180 family protein [Streptomyces xinghaiensis]
MNCLTCTLHGDTAPATGLCHTCGTGVCREHTRIGLRHVRRGPIIGPALYGTERRLLCPDCATAGAETPVAVTTAA